MSKRIISLFLALSFILVSCQLTFAEGETVYDISAGSQTITTSGDYRITGTTTTNTLTIGQYDGSVFADITVNLILDNVNISSETTNAIRIYPNAKVNLTLVGSNTLTSTASRKSALLVDTSGGILSKLTINGSGSLRVSSGDRVAAIGSQSSGSGEIVINGGRITATVGNYAAAIGAAYNQTNGPITINGGYIKVTGTRGIGCGGNKAPNTWGDIVVNGGSIVEDVTNTWEGLGYQPKNSEGKDVSKITLTMPDVSADANKELTINGWGTVTDDAAKLYTYVTEDTTSIAAKSSNGDIYYCKNMNIAATKTYTLSRYSGGPCSCVEGDAFISLNNVESSAAVNIVEKRKEIELKGEFIPSSSCDFPIHSAPSDITYSIDEKNNMGADLSGIAEISGNILTVYSSAVGKTLVLTAVTENNSISYTASKEITVTQDDSIKFDISENNITITNKDSDNLNVQVGDIDFAVPKDKEIAIYQKTALTQNHITVSADVTINLDNVNINAAGVNNAIKVDNGAALNLKLNGNNTLIKAIIGDDNATLHISGNGTLNVKGDSTAAIGKFADTVIDSGTITATGGNLCAGIGGNVNSKGSNVTINGGKITATGQGYAAGIGGGQNGSGGTVVINGGMVEASSSGGYGIGGGSVTSSANHGTVTINGGSVNATIGADMSKYMCMLSGIAANRDVEYTIGDSAETIKTSTDGSGRLYFYLPEGENKIKVICDGKTYYERLDIDSSKTNTGVLSSEITADITLFKIMGREATINQDTREISITLPNNLNLANVEAKIEQNGYKVVLTEGSIQELSAKYTVFGDDGVTDKTYNLTITLTEPGNEKDILDISEGNIYISSSGVSIFAGDSETPLTPNPNGYIITGTSDTNALIIEDDISDIDVVFWDLHIKSTSESAPSMEIYGSVNITLEGDNIIEATQAAAITSDGVGDINISGTGNLTVKGGAGAPALDINNSSLNITSPSDAADSGKIILEGGSGSQAVTNGAVSTNTTTNLKIIDNGTEKTSVTDGSASLNAVKVILPVENAENKKCTYSSKNFTLDADSAFYLMLPDGEHTISVTYNNNTYLKKVTVNGEALSVTLEGEKIENVTLSSPAAMTYKGGKATFVVEGIIDPNKTKVQFVPNKDGFETLTANVTFDAENDRHIVTVTFPENASDTETVKYTIKGLISDKVVYTAEATFDLPVNNTYCDITKFTIEGGASEINSNLRRIDVTFPFDHVWKGNYEVNIEHTGGNVTSPTTAGPSTYAFGVIDSYEHAARFVVTAKDGKTTKTYTAVLSAKNTPVIQNVTVDTSSLTNKGGKLKVEIEGGALGNIAGAEKAENRVVTVSVGDKSFTATPETRDKVWYVAEIDIDANPNTTERKLNVTVQVGSEDLGISKTVQITQPKGDSDNVNIKTISIANQIVGSWTSLYKYSILMPFDANLTSLTPTIVLEDKNASYTPTGAQDFTSGDIIYTVTAQNGTTRIYTVSVTKQAEPVATGVSFTAPATGAVNNLDFTVDGDNLENIEAAISGGEIVVKCTPQGGGAAITGTAELKNGKYVASLTGFSNNDTTADKIYTVSVEINGKAQTLTGGNPTLTVPRRKSDTCDIADFKLIDGQTDLSIVDDTITLKVPYNTDLRSLTPQITLEDSKGQYSDAGIAKNFENDVTYIVTSESGKTKTYTVRVSRDGQAGVTAAAFEQPLSNKPGNVVITLTGNFINSLGDAITVTATPQDGGDAINAVIDYTEYAGAATATLSLPDNEEETEKKYTVSITMNSIEQTISNNEIVVPAKKPCSILSFKVGDIVARPDADNKITLKVPYETDLTKITPLITIEGESCNPASGTEQDFTNPVAYTVTQGEETKTYEVTITRDGKPSINAVTIKNAPTSNKGGQVTVELDGVFWNSAKVKVIAPDSTSQEVNMTVSEAGKATAEITVPTNDSLTDEAEYTLEFYLDGFAEKIENASADKITVPAKKPCSILSFKVGDVVAVPDSDNKIALKVPYETDLTKITPEIEIEGDRYEQTGEQDFTSPVTYTVYDGSNTNTYEVTITRDGKPSINAVTIKNAPTSNKGGQVTVELEGVFWNSAKVKVIAPDNTSQEVNMTVSEAGKASAAINIAENTSTTDDMEYKLEFYLDGFEDKAEYNEDVKIIVPFRKNNANMESSSSRVKPKTTPVPTPLPEQTEKPSDGQATPEPSQTPDITPKTMPYIRGYEEFGLKLFKPENTITRAEVAAIMSLIDADFDENVRYLNVFGDVADDAWYSNYVNYASEKGYIQGYDDGTSRPENNITRAEFVSIMARYMNVELYTGMSLFKDIDNVAWCRNQINTLAQLGIVNGYDDAMFKPDQFISRAETVTIVNRVLGRKMTDEIREKLNNPFDDITSDHWAYDNVLLASCEY